MHVVAIGAEQTAMQAVYNFQITFRQNPAQQVVLPDLCLQTMLPREWPLARMCISFRQVNKYLRTPDLENTRSGEYMRIPDED